jgi:hypothetical protein
MREYEITVIAGENAGETIKQALAEKGLRVESVRDIPLFDEWLETLPDCPVPGLADEVALWFRRWSNGGGDLSTEVSATEVCESDHPRELARAIYEEIAGYSKSDFDAKQLVMEALNCCLNSAG